MSHLKTGAKGEESAAAYLRSKGYDILATNWRTGRKEIDIIAWHQGMAVFVEVKTRSGKAFGWPEEAVSPAKQALLAEAATVWLEENNFQGEFRFDVVSIIRQGNERQIFHIEDAFAP